jgi:hypothetical protein
MAGTKVITGKEYSSGIKVVTIVFTADADDASFVTASLGGERGKELVNVFVKAGSTGPTDNCDLSIVDGTTSRDLVATNGPNSVDNSGTNYVAPETASFVVGDLTVDPDLSDENAVNSAEVTVYAVFKSKNL